MKHNFGKNTAVFALGVLLAGSAAAQAPTPFDGNWRGTSDGGSCNAPLDVTLSIESGIVDGTAYDTSAKGPVPNQRKAAPPPATPGLWQLHGIIGTSGTSSLIATASVRDRDRREARMTVRRDGAGLTMTEDSGCRRTARLVKG
jgi:hypothetical protein